MRTSIIWLSVLLFLAGCIYPARMAKPVAPTLETAIQQINGCSMPLQNFQVRGVRQWHKGFVVLYTALCPPHQGNAEPTAQFGHAFVRRDGGQWLSGSGLALNIRDFHPGEFADIERSGGSDEQRQHPFSILFGRARPEVALVEVVLDDGSALKDQITSEMFAIIWDGEAKALQVRLMTADSQLIQQQDLPQLKDS